MTTDIYQLAQDVNERLFGDVEEELDIVINIIGEILHAYKLCHGEKCVDCMKKISIGEMDNIIIGIMRVYHEEGGKSLDILSAVNYFHKNFKLVFYPNGSSVYLFWNF